MPRNNTPFEPRIYRLLIRLREESGALVSEASCTLEEAELAKITNRYSLDSDGYGYVLLQGLRK